MTKYHVKPDGSLGVCNAKQKCRYSKFIHVNANSLEEAQQQVDDFNKIIAEFLEPGGTITEDGVKIELIKHGKCLDILEKDPDYHVRRNVAKQGHNPALFAIDSDEVTRDIAQRKIAEEKDPKIKEQYKEQLSEYINGTTAQKLACVNAGIGILKLAEDSDKYVRGEVAIHDYLPEVLANDKDPYVRSQVALSGNCHDILSRDEDEQVRASVASCCDKAILAKMVNDERPLVRQYVAFRGNLLDKEHLDKLLNDESAYVQRDAKRCVAKLAEM